MRQSRRGLIFQVAAMMRAVRTPLTAAATGATSTSAAVAAQPIEEKASAKVARREEVWRRRNWLRLACTRNQSWIAVADTVAMMMPSVVMPACKGEARASMATSGANTAVIAINTTSTLALTILAGGN